MGEVARYFFAVTRGADPDVLGVLRGMSGAPVQVVEHDGLQAVVCDVDLEEFGESALPVQLEDMSWLEEVARTHNDVVLGTSEVAVVAPMRLVTICHDDESVRARLASVHDELVAALDRVEGRREWSVKVYAVADHAAEHDAAVDEGEGGGAGAAYLMRKRRQAVARRSAADLAAQDAEAVHEELSQQAVAARRLPAQDPRLSGATLPMTLNGAYLVDEQDERGFRDLVEQVARDHPASQVELEGPWPPYSFAVVDQR